MKPSATTTQWHKLTAALIAADDFDTLSESLRRLIGVLVRNGRLALLAFSEDAPPTVITHDLRPAEEKHYLHRYIAGPYLLDPLYQLALSNDKPHLCRFREAAPDRFKSSEYYRQYCEKTHLQDELDFILDTDSATTLVLVVAKLQGRFSKADIASLQDVEPVIRASMRKIWISFDERAGQDDRALSMHERLTRCFQNFGEARLTQREREITQLLLRGHSTKSIARELDIAPGTVMVHKRNLFAKLGITSQYELFSSFIDALSAA